MASRHRLSSTFHQQPHALPLYKASELRSLVDGAQVALDDVGRRWAWRDQMPRDGTLRGVDLHEAGTVAQRTKLPRGVA